MSMKKSLGLVEAKGLCAGVAAADVVVKAANVKLIGYEFARGDGWTTIKVTGDVGAVKAAVQAAVAALNKMGKLATYKVIARPANALEMLTYNPVTVGYTPEPSPDTTPEPPAGPEKKTEESAEGSEEPSEDERDEPVVTVPEPESAVPSEPAQETKPENPVEDQDVKVSEAAEPAEDTPAEAPAPAEVSEEKVNAVETVEEQQTAETKLSEGAEPVEDPVSKQPEISDQENASDTVKTEPEVSSEAQVKPAKAPRRRRKKQS